MCELWWECGCKLSALAAKHYFFTVLRNCILIEKCQKLTAVKTTMKLFYKTSQKMLTGFLFCFFSWYLISEKDECLGAVLCSASLSLMQELISASSVMYEMKAKFSLEKKMLFDPPLSSQWGKTLRCSYLATLNFKKIFLWKKSHKKSLEIQTISLL